MKYIKQPKRYIVLDHYEWKALVNGINECRKQVIGEGGHIENLNELLVKIIDAPTRKKPVMPLLGALRCGKKPPVKPGEDKKAVQKRKTSKYNGKCLTTHYQKHEEVLHNEK